MGYVIVIVVVGFFAWVMWKEDRKKDKAKKEKQGRKEGHVKPKDRDRNPPAH